MLVAHLHAEKYYCIIGHKVSGNFQLKIQSQAYILFTVYDGILDQLNPVDGTMLAA